MINETLRQELLALREEDLRVRTELADGENWAAPTWLEPGPPLPDEQRHELQQNQAWWDRWFAATAKPQLAYLGAASAKWIFRQGKSTLRNCSSGLQ